jgi:glutathione S-transferase
VKLIGTCTSPYTRKVRIVALEKRIGLELEIDNPMEPGSYVPTFNPLAKVPVLLRPDGEPLVDSPVIAEFLDGLAPEPRLIPPSGAERFAVKHWEAVCDGVLDAAVLMRMEGLRPESERSANWIARQREKVERSLAWLDGAYGAHHFAVGEHFTLADIALGCTMGYLGFRFADGRWHERFAHLSRAVSALEERPSFMQTAFRA